MNLRNNISESFKSIKDNLLRTILTATIIAIGIMSLVGILTAIDGMKASITESLSTLGANSFEIYQKRTGRRRGEQRKVYPRITYRQALKFKKEYDYSNSVGIYEWVSGLAEAKRHSKKTNPNSEVIAIDENYLNNEGYNLIKGRGLSSQELIRGLNVAIIGEEIVETLFGEENPLNEEILVLGKYFKIIGVIESTGGVFGGSGTNRNILIPLVASLPFLNEPSFGITVGINTEQDLEYAMGMATGLMRQIRKDPLNKEDSFTIERSDSISSTLDEISGNLRMGGFIIGFITLLGASIGLMNIMLVSVTERTREIGVRKALGAKPGTIREQFLIEAIVICQLGGIAGVVLGLGIGNIIAVTIGSRVFVVPWLWMFVGIVICLVVGVISGFYPAGKASRLDPIEALRHE
ncbi:MAG: ABC transporter permease [Cytophagales bacterium]